MAARRAAEKPAVPKRKVFVVDDHPIVRERLAELIGQEADASRPVDSLTDLSDGQNRDTVQKIGPSTQVD